MNRCISGRGGQRAGRQKTKLTVQIVWIADINCTRPDQQPLVLAGFFNNSITNSLMTISWWNSQLPSWSCYRCNSVYFWGRFHAATLNFQWADFCAQKQVANAAQYYNLIAEGFYWPKAFSWPWKNYCIGRIPIGLLSYVIDTKDAECRNNSATR